MQSIATTSHAPASQQAPRQRLYVDMDGTLLNTDMLFESFIRFVCQHPWRLLQVIVWALYGPANLKARLAQHYDQSPETLPWNEALLAYLREQAAGGRILILATAAHESIARGIAAHASLFQAVLASNGTINLKGKNKAAAILEHAAGEPFAYAGNDMSDMRVWQHAQGAILVNASASTARSARHVTTIEKEFPRAKAIVRVLPRALRVHQWLKNLLVFCPLMGAQAWSDVSAWGSALTIFLAFSLCASGIYCLNDLIDLPSDRMHPRKRTRPLAAGTLPIRDALLLAPVLVLAGLALAANINLPSLIVVCCYIVITTAYSFVLKRIVLVDVIVLAGLYTIRVIAGGVAIDANVSFWMLALAMFLFLSLALIKRYSELVALLAADRTSASGRDYRVADRGVIQALGAASGFCAVMVMALFLNSGDVAARYSRPYILWGLCITLMYWIARMWLKASRGEMHDDPLVYAATDRASLFMGLISALVIAAAL